MMSENFPVIKIEKEKRERPSVLYHASSNPNIEEFTPQNKRTRDPDEGPVIFATPDKSLASTFLIEGHDDSWLSIGYYSGISVPVVVIRADREEFIKKDRGGTLYYLPSDSFDFHPYRGMREKEWTSTTPVKPTKKESLPSTLDAMIENNVQVYFVNQSTFDSIENAKGKGRDILSEIRSENDLRGQSNLLRKQS